MRALDMTMYSIFSVESLNCDCSLDAQMIGRMINHNMTTPRFGSAIFHSHSCKCLIPVTSKVRIPVSLEAFRTIQLEAKANVVHSLEVLDNIHYCLAMILTRIS